ncbi:4-hydroxybenzoate octaprenyltransferase [Sodalis sp. CWE]|uniref:4-hydroxybenzoate octaprenyltransferase n=1 Tax=Sodalis sp. CWE TaxID=2803816 RepID=UPI001C7D9763|nr:4-hydroxybenzoate octaprenyltransferase [Sodalis sp. CWE]MBX4180693.1 4-hydroxybenzoate octaprenyltransferase [Sodalis sp. CWE]
MNYNFIKNKWKTWCCLIRINKPIGLFLLLWPTLWALWLASMAVPKLKTLVVFMLGVFFMRAAGCVINDYIDYDIDLFVKRTCNRPLPNQKIKKKEARILLIFLLGVSFILALTLDIKVIALSVVALILACVYPFMKRYMYFPQLILGIAFSCSIPMVFIEVSQSLPLHCWLLFLANVIWTIAYDTQYSIIDRDDDMIIGIKSTAILFGNLDRVIIMLLHLMMLLLLGAVGIYLNLNGIYFLSLASATWLFIWQQQITNASKSNASFQAFLKNNFVGMVIFIGIFFGLPLQR